jgi:hypothetical protein
MIPKLVSDLHAIAAKPDSSPGTMLIVTRRTCRILLSIRDDIWNERKAFQRKAEKLRKDLPYSILDMEALQDQASAHRREECDYISARLAQFGRLMSADGGGIASALGFERLCDVLNVNPIHRAEARTEGVTLRGVIFEARVEDSADVRNVGWCDGGPLCQAFFAAYMEEVRANSRAERAEAPGPVDAPIDFERPVSVFAAASVMVH